MLSHFSNTQKGILLAFAGYAGFAVSDVCAKYLTQSYSIYQVVALDAFCACLVMLAVSRFLPGKSTLRTQKPWIHILRGVTNFLATIFIVWGFSKLPMPTVYTIVFILPFVASLLTIVLYKERVPTWRWLIIAFGFCGILIAMRPGTDHFTPLMFLPMLTAFFSALMFVVSKSLDNENTFALGFYPAAMTGLLALPFMISGFEMVAFFHWVIFLIGGAGVATGIIGLTLAFRMAPSAAVSPMHYTQIIWGVIFGYLFFADLPDVWTIAGAAVIITSGIILLETERRLSIKKEA